MRALKHRLINIGLFEIMAPDRHELLCPGKPIDSLLAQTGSLRLFPILIFYDHHVLCDQLNLSQLRIILIQKNRLIVFLVLLTLGLLWSHFSLWLGKRVLVRILIAFRRLHQVKDFARKLFLNPYFL